MTDERVKEDSKQDHNFSPLDTPRPRGSHYIEIVTLLCCPVDLNLTLDELPVPEWGDDNCDCELKNVCQFTQNSFQDFIIIREEAENVPSRKWDVEEE